MTVRLTRSATASLRFEQRVKRGRRMVWKAYRTRSMKATASAGSVTLKGLKKGSYRVKVTVGRSAKTKSFTVVTEPGARSPRDRPRGFRHHEGGRLTACRLGVLALGDSITNGGGELQWGVALQSWALWVARGLGLPFTTFAVDGARVAHVAGAQLPALRERSPRPTRAMTSAACTPASTTSAHPTGTREAFAADYALALCALAARCDRRARGHDPARPRPPARRRARRGGQRRDRGLRAARRARARPARASARATS